MATIATLETAFPKLAWAYVNRLRVHPTKLIRASDGGVPETATEYIGRSMAALVQCGHPAICLCRLRNRVPASVRARSLVDRRTSLTPKRLTLHELTAGWDTPTDCAAVQREPHSAIRTNSRMNSKRSGVFMTPPLFVIRIGAFSFDASILSVSVRAQCPVVCLGDLKKRPILSAVPEAAGQ